MVKRLIFSFAIASCPIFAALEIDPFSCCADEPNECGSVFSIYGDFLYWQTSVNGMPYAVTGTNSTIGDPPFASFINNDKIREIKFSYEPAFRVGASWIFDRGWQINCNWERLRSSASDSLFAESPEVINETFFFFPLFLANLRADQSMHYDRLVGRFLKKISLGSHFTSDFSFGALGSWINQKLDIRGSGVLDTGGGAVSSNHRTRLKNNFSGAGIRVGFGTDYSPIEMFSIYGEGNFSLLYGGFDVAQNDRLVIDDPIIGTLIKQGGSNPRAVVSEWDLSVGLRGHYQFENFKLMGHVSYEFALWPNQVRVFRTFSNTDGTSFPLLGRGDVSFQGLSTGLGLSF